jgi:1-pyrroline-5-carboxylate dehydrogenase
MGGKNATIITDRADVDKAAMGVMRSAFGLQGQKCSACSRVLVHKDLKEQFTSKLLDLTKDIKVGDPTVKENWMGPVINEAAFKAYQKYVRDMQEAGGEVIFGGEVLDDRGYFVAPTIVDGLPSDHYTWTHEMFVPIVAVDSFDDKEEAMRLANDVELGLTAGFFSEDQEEVDWFLDNIEAGCVYVNRSSGATTGAWPGYQSFGGWKGSSATMKAAGSHYYIQQYMREQSHTIVE